MHGPLAQTGAHAAHEGDRDAGRPLDATTRAAMEHQFGEDFGDVRLHDGPRARRSAQALQARAFTFGPHVVFEQTTLPADSPADRRLLAHELGHVVQQRRGNRDGSRAASTGAHEADADRAADDVMAGRAATVRCASAPQPQCENKNKNRQAFNQLPRAMIEDLKRQGLLPEDAAPDTLVVGDLSPEVVDAILKRRKQGDPYGSSPFVIPLPGTGSGTADPNVAWPFFQPDTAPTFPALDPLRFPFQLQPQGSGTPAPKKPPPKPPTAAPALVTPEGMPATQTGIDALGNEALLAEMKNTLQWLRKSKSSSAKVEQVARYYQGLCKAYRERQSELELRRAYFGPERTIDQRVGLQTAGLNIRAEIGPAFTSLGGDFIIPSQVVEMIDDRDEQMRDVQLPQVAGEGPGGLTSLTATAPEADPHFLDNFTGFSYDGMSKAYVLKFADGAEVQLPRRLIDDPDYESWIRKGGRPTGVEAFKTRGSQATGIHVPMRYNAGSLPNLYATIESNRQAIENADAGAFVARNLLTYEDIPGADTISRITFGLSLARAGAPLAMQGWQKYRGPTPWPEDAGPGPLPPPPAGATGQRIYWPTPGEAGNDNAFPGTPLARTGTGDFFYPIPQPRPKFQLRLVPSPDADAPPLWQPADVPVATAAGGGSGGGGWSFGWGGFQPAPTTDVSSTRVSVGGTWSSQSKRKAALQNQQKAVEAEIAAEIDRINTRRGSISASDWKDQRAGLTKRLFNLREQQHALQIALQKPEAVILTQVRVLGVVDATGAFKTTEAVAGSGRIPDVGVLQPKGPLRLLDSKTANEVVNSISKRGTPQLKPSSPIGKQVAKEEKLRAEGGDWVLQGTDLATQESFTFRMSDADIQNSKPVPYGQIDN